MRWMATLLIASASSCNLGEPEDAGGANVDCWAGRTDLREPPELCAVTCRTGEDCAMSNTGRRCIFVEACGSGGVCVTTEEALRSLGCSSTCAIETGSEPVIITDCVKAPGCCSCCPGE